MGGQLPRLNRTNVELKSVYNYVRYRDKEGLNRTNVELKLYYVNS